VALENLHDRVIESPHRVGSGLVYSQGSVEVGNVEVTSHDFVASYLSPLFFGHSGFSSIHKFAKSSKELGLSSLVSRFIISLQKSSTYADKIIAGVHDVVIPVGTDRVHGVQTKANSQHAKNSICFLESLSISHNMR
jgi:hypothetical protein